MISTILYGILVGGITSIHTPAFESGGIDKIKAEAWLWAKKIALFSTLSALFYYLWLSPISQELWVPDTLAFAVILFGLNTIWDGGSVPLAAFLLCILLFIGGCSPHALEMGRMRKAYASEQFERDIWSQTPPPLSPLGTPPVSYEQAAAAGGKIVQERFGSRYLIGSFALQKVNGSTVWVAPLEVTTLAQDLFEDYGPAVVVVDATDPNVPARLIARDSHDAPIKLKFTPRGFLGRNLVRHINSEKGFLSFAKKEAHLQVDDAMKPWWVVIGYQPIVIGSFFPSCQILVIDPETGKVKEFLPDALPPWVDLSPFAKRTAMQPVVWNFVDGRWIA